MAPLQAVRRLKAEDFLDRFAATHFDLLTGGSAHFGPGFLGWHRELLKRYITCLFFVSTVEFSDTYFELQI
jgi:hypothetical protein